MCEQCGTEMLLVYGEERNGVHLYVGIARADWGRFDPGDVMVGYGPAPDVVLKDDLFTLEEWNLIDEDEEAWEALVEEHGDDYRAADRFMDMDPYWYGEDQFHWSSFAEAAIRLDRHFGPRPEGFGNWTAWPVVNVARLFVEAGIPLSKMGRRNWALQFSKDVDSVLAKEGQDGIRIYEIFQYFLDETGEADSETEWKGRTIQWKENEPLPPGLTDPRKPDES